MTTAIRNGQVLDELQRPVQGASIYVYNLDGSAAALTSDGITPLSQPLTTDSFGNYSYTALVGYYREDTWYSGKLRFRENNIALGNPGADLALRTDLAAVTGSSLSGFSQSGTGAVTETVQSALRRIVFADQFGVKADGATDDTVNLQKALDYIGGLGGGILYLPRGTIIISQSALVWSGTIVIGQGRNATIVKAKQSGFAGTNAANTCYLLRNKNFTASSITDTNIQIERLGFDYGTVTIGSGGGAHAIAMRFVDGVTVRDCYAANGENFTAFRACKDTLVANSEGFNLTNCYFDHWEAAGTAKVANCIGRNSGTFIAQGIQFTGTGSAGEDLSSIECFVEGCYLDGVRGSGSLSSAIISNANDAGSATYRFKSIGNTVKNSDNGIVLAGSGGQHLSLCDTLIGVDQAPIIVELENGNTPAECRVLFPQLVDCNHTVGNVALISVSGTKNEVLRPKVSYTTAPAYTTILTFTAAAVGCRADISGCPSGSGVRVADAGSGSVVIDAGQPLTSTSVAGYSVLPGEDGKVFTVGCTVTLPPAASYPGREWFAVNTTAAAVISNASNVIPLASSTAGTAILAASAGKWARLKSDGTNWRIVAAN